MEKLKGEALVNKSKSVKILIGSIEFREADRMLKEMLNENLEHPKLLELKHLIEQRVKENPKSKSIVFSQFRDSVTKISKELNSLENVSAKVFVGQAKKPGSGLSQKEQQQLIREFSNGEFNVLCATSIGEEGLDIPEVNAVIFYEPVPSAIRKIQRTGRTARLMPGELIMLITKDTRDEIFHWASISKEKRMHKALKEIKQDLKETGKINLNKTQKKLF
jgi:ERCC4-related helicase